MYNTIQYNKIKKDGKKERKKDRQKDRQQERKNRSCRYIINALYDAHSILIYSRKQVAQIVYKVRKEQINEIQQNDWT